MKIFKLLLAGILLIFSTSLNAEEPPIKIGAALHLTGEYPTQGEAFREGAELAIDQINGAGGINGRNLELIVDDSQYKALTANTIAKKFIHVDKVSAAIIGTITEVMASGPEFERAHVPLIVLWDSAPEIEEIGKYVFAIGAWAPSSGEKGAEFLHANLKAKRVVVINTNNEWPRAVTEVFKKKFESLGGKVLEIFSVNPADSDFRTVLIRAKSLKPDAIYAPVPDNIVPFYKQLHQVKISVPVVTADVLTEDLIKQLGTAVEGVFQTQVADPSVSTTKEFSVLYHKKFGHEPGMTLFNAWGYDAINILAEAMKKSGSDPEKITEGLYNIDKFPGVSGNISINEKGSSPISVSMFQVRKGKLEPVN